SGASAAAIGDLLIPYQGFPDIAAGFRPVPFDGHGTDATRIELNGSTPRLSSAVPNRCLDQSGVQLTLESALSQRCDRDRHAGRAPDHGRVPAGVLSHRGAARIRDPN